jgi:methyltransferase of ATP-grasp peptide maturase system
MSDWRARARALADELTAKGTLSSSAWRRAVAEVPRHEFVPSYYEYTSQGWRMADTISPQGRERWLDRVYSNAALFILPEGRSSSSMPSLMTRMLEALDIRDGHKVLEIGTGSGYNAALLCHRLGDDRVYSVEIEPGLVELARARLVALGYRPTLVTGNGAEGLAEYSPYDRIVATCSVRAVPWVWVRQVRVGGLILVDVKPRAVAGNLVLLRRYEDRAEGRFDARYGSFMAMREAPDSAPAEDSPRPQRDRSSADQRTTSVDLPRPWENLVFWFFANIHSDLHIVQHGQGMDPATKQPGDAFLVDQCGAWCEISAHPNDRGQRRVWQAGPRRLWDDIEAAYHDWEHLDRPGWERFGLTVTEKDHTVWLDDPDSPHRWLL